jgi:[CysO sulfur-carrier protein]-S-L-cysteine hydrolase
MTRINKHLKKSMHQFEMTEDIYNELISYCQENLPFEACGLISGKNNFGCTLWKLRNEAESPYRFAMSKEAVISTLRQIAELSEELVAIFHSHPHTPAIPSQRDILFNPYPELAYFIVSLREADPEVGCFRINGKNLEELQLKIHKIE